jgi:hypothetical protein
MSILIHTPLGPDRYQCLIRVLTDEEISLQVVPIQLDVSPYSLFVGSIRSPVTKEKYLQRMGYFFDYLSIHQKDVEERFEISQHTGYKVLDFRKCNCSDVALRECSVKTRTV